MTHLRVIKRPDPVRDGMDVRELDERDSAFSLLHDFGVTDFAQTQPAELRLVPTEFDTVMERLSKGRK